MSLLPAFYTPRIDVAEDARSLPIHLDVPGVRQADLEITVEKNAVAVRGRRRLESPAGLRLAPGELGGFDYERSFRLPDEIDRESIKA